MADYCSLHISSNVQAELPVDFWQTGELGVSFTDNETPERRASFARLAKKGVLRRTNLPRYHWTLSSEGFVEGFDVCAHLAWVLGQIRSDYLLSDLKNMGYESWLQFYWESNGTGAGPLVTVQAAELLTRHAVSLQFGFYWRE